MPILPKILYQDQELIALDKPAGLLSVPGRGADKADSLSSRVQAFLPEAKIVHRLDCHTSGIMLMALNPESHKKLNAAFHDRQVTKTYIAEVFGSPSAQQGSIGLPLRCDWEHRPRQMVDPEKGKTALTYWQLLFQKESSSILKLTPITGRTHQLRVHMQALDHPILGDRLYAHDKALHKADRLLLHAQDLQIPHPVTGEPIQFHSPCPFYKM